MELTIHVQAPELARAIEALAAAIGQARPPRFEDGGIIAQPTLTVAGQAETAATQAPNAQVASPTAALAQQGQPPQQPVPAAPASAVPTAPPAAQTTTAAQAPPTVPEPQPAPAAVPTAAPSYTLDQLAVAATQLMDAGRRAELVQLLQSFGVQALTALPKEQYGAFATKLRELGAKL